MLLGLRPRSIPHRPSRSRDSLRLPTYRTVPGPRPAPKWRGIPTHSWTRLGRGGGTPRTHGRPPPPTLLGLWGDVLRPGRLTDRGAGQILRAQSSFARRAAHCRGGPYRPPTMARDPGQGAPSRRRFGETRFPGTRRQAVGSARRRIRILLASGHGRKISPGAVDRMLSCGTRRFAVSSAAHLPREDGTGLTADQGGQEGRAGGALPSKRDEGGGGAEEVAAREGRGVVDSGMDQQDVDKALQWGRADRTPRAGPRTGRAPDLGRSDSEGRGDESSGRGADTVGPVRRCRPPRAVGGRPTRPPGPQDP